MPSGSSTGTGAGPGARSGSPSPFGQALLVVGPEALLAERAVADQIRRIRAEDPATEVSEVEAARLDGGRLAEITGASLFSTRRAAVITGLADLPAELADTVAQLGSDPGPDLVLILVHPGGPKGKGLLDRLRRSGVPVVECAAWKPWELPRFVQAEGKRAGGTIPPEAARVLIESVGHDLRSLAAAAGQLVADSPDTTVSAAQVRRYFGGRAEVTSFAVADAVLSGRTGPAMEQLRWAMATGVPAVLVTSALASGIRGLGRLISAPTGLREADLAREVGVPPWKLKSLRAQARGWDGGGLAAALQSVATADAAIKGAAEDAEFALEQAVLAVSRARRN